MNRMNNENVNAGEFPEASIDLPGDEPLHIPLRLVRCDSKHEVEVELKLMLFTLG